MDDATCSVEECVVNATRRGLCEMHYRRLMKHGSTDDPRPTPEERFWRKVKVGTADECWEWQGASLLSGYGRIAHPERTAHRVSWVMANGPIPGGMFVCHSCDNPPCVNPAHLWVGTTSDNMQDMIRKGRHGWARH